MALWKEPNAAAPPSKEPTGRAPEMSTITPLNQALPRRMPERADAKLGDEETFRDAGLSEER